MRYHQTKQYFESRIANAKQNVVNQEELQQTAIMINDDELLGRAERALRLMRTNLQTLIQRRDEIGKDKQGCSS